MNCLVTGATGFVGRQLCEYLLANQHQVIAHSRSGVELPRMEVPGMEVPGMEVPGMEVPGMEVPGVEVPGGLVTVGRDLALQPPESAWFDGVDTVFHLAGIAHRRAPETACEQVNNRATVALARAAATAGVKCFIFLSSVKAMGPAPDDRPRAEHEVFPAEDAYGRSKWAAECALRDEFAGSAMSVIILRPALVYGPGARGNLQLLATAVRRGLPRPPAGGARSMVSSRDLVELMSLLASAPPAGVHTWIVSDGHDYTTRGIYDLMRRARDLGTGRAWLPGWGWRLAAGLIDLARPGDPLSTYDRLFAPERYDNGALIRATGWRPQHRLDEAAARLMMENRQVHR
jgi:nucleoside-diphosphate-sugar epimerase